jgi:hypothetical protein
VSSWAVEQFLTVVIAWFTGMVIGALTVLWDLLSVTAFVSPDVTVLPQVTAFAGTSLGIVNVCYVLAFLWAAMLVMGRDTIQSQVGPGELIPRLVIGLIAANVALPLCSSLIGLANAVTAALTSQDITAPGSMRQLRAITVGALDGQSGDTAVGLLTILIGLLIAVLTGTLLVQWIIRLGVLVVAVGVAPIALALHGTPQTEPAAKLWWRAFLGALGVVVIQAVALHTTLRVFLDPDSNLQVLGLPVPGGEPAAIMNLFIVVCLLWGVVKIPGLMGRYITQSRPNAVGTVLRVVLIQQITQGLRRGLNGGRGAGGRSAGGGRSAASAAANRPWPVRPAAGGFRTASASPAAHPPRPAVSTPRPAGAGPARTGVTRRPARPYTRDELAGGVDLYTRAMKARAGASPRKAP